MGGILEYGYREREELGYSFCYEKKRRINIHLLQETKWKRYKGKRLETMRNTVRNSYVVDALSALVVEAATLF